MPEARLDPRALQDLLPMHLWLDDAGRVLSVGRTLAKLVPGVAGDAGGAPDRHLAQHLACARPGQGPCSLAAIRAAVDRHLRLFLRVVATPDVVLRGHGVRMGDGTMLVNLGFGIGLHRAIRAADLTDDDFAPSELAMELLFLHEANRAVLTELSRFNDQLAQSREVALQQAQTDPLTGLFNRRGLEIALDRALRSPLDRPETCPLPFALIHLDLDHFKQVNDSLGHQAGDDLLRAVGAVLRSQIRKADTAARIGGDEFVMIVKGMTSRAGLEQLTQRIIRAVGDLSPPELGVLKVSASLGVVIWAPGGTTDPIALLALADAELYRAKEAGRGCARIA